MTVIKQSFHERNITLTFHLAVRRTLDTEISTYGIQFTSDFAVKQIRIDFESSANTTTAELSISYNIWYNFSAFAILCGRKTQSETISLFYGEYTGIIITKSVCI